MWVHIFLASKFYMTEIGTWNWIVITGEPTPPLDPGEMELFSGADRRQYQHVCYQQVARKIRAKQGNSSTMAGIAGSRAALYGASHTGAMRNWAAAGTS
jgi:hypothetical protein